MRNWQRYIRGAIGIGLTWAAAWFGVGLALLAVVGPDAADVPFPLFFGFLGFIAGALFSAILRLLGDRRPFEQMSLPRFSGWGALGGLVLSAVFIPIAGPGVSLLVLAPVFAVAGALSAAGTLALARRAGPAPPGLAMAAAERALEAGDTGERRDDPR